MQTPATHWPRILGALMGEFVVFFVCFSASGLALWAVMTGNAEALRATIAWFVVVAVTVYIATGVIIPGGELITRGLDAIVAHLGPPGIIGTVSGGIMGAWIAQAD